MGYKDVPAAEDWLQNSDKVMEHLSCIKNLNTTLGESLKKCSFNQGRVVDSSTTMSFTPLCTIS